MRLLDKITGGRADKLFKFGSASVVGILISQIVLVVAHGVMDIDAFVSNLLAVSISAGPVFLLNKRWVWGLSGRSSMRREVIPFWLFTLLGLVISTVLVVVTDHYTDRTWPVLLANITGFGLVWVSKFLFLDSVVFGAMADAAAEAAEAAAQAAHRATSADA